MIWDWINEFVNIFWAITLEMAPWLLLGCLFAGIFHVFMPQSFTKHHLGSNSFKSALKAVLLGIPLPLCSCGVIPTAISLRKNGASESATQGFLIATPQTGVDSILATYALLGWPLAIIRPLMAFLSGVLGGWFTSYFYPKSQSEEVLSQPDDEKSSTSIHQFKSVIQYGFYTILQDISKWLLLGIALAALISMWVPDDFFQENFSSFYVQLVIVLLISIPFYVCATGSIPIALSLILKGLSPAAAILFLMVGPATNVATMVVLQKTLGRKFFFLYLFSIVVLGVGFSILIHNVFSPEFLFQGRELLIQNHQMHVGIIHQILAIILMSLILLTFIPLKYIQKSTPMDGKSVSVEGMTCSHCEANVEKNIMQLDGVEDVKADQAKNTLEIKGNPNWEEVRKLISELGYKPKF